MFVSRRESAAEVLKASVALKEGEHQYDRPRSLTDRGCLSVWLFSAPGEVFVSMCCVLRCCFLRLEVFSATINKMPECRLFFWKKCPILRWRVLLSRGHREVGGF